MIPILLKAFLQKKLELAPKHNYLFFVIFNIVMIFLLNY